MTGTDMGGFFLSGDKQFVIVVIFAIYSIVLMGIGLFVKISSKCGGGSGKLASFVTGSGNLTAIELAMITATTSLAAGTMVGTPGVTFRTGLVYSLAMVGCFVSAWCTLGTFGTKFAIMRRRLGVQTVCQLMRHRFQSKTVSVVMALSGALFSIIMAGGQMTSAAKVFAAVTGGKYMLGLLIAGVCVAAYTLCGGVKSMARVCVVQGFVMLAAVVMFAVVERNAIAAEYGTLQAAMEMFARTQDGINITTSGYKPLQAIGLCMVTAWGVSGIPGVMQNCLYYENRRVMIRGAVIATLTMVLVMGVMCTSGQIAHILNPNLTAPDWTAVYISGAFMPSWGTGIVVCGIFAAIQSTIAGWLVFAAATLVLDVYKCCIKPDMDDEKSQKYNIAILWIGIIISFAIALKPGDLVQMLLIFASGSAASTFLFPSFVGTYWKKATTPAMITGVIAGPVIYVVTTLLAKGAWWQAHGNIHPILLGTFIPLVLMIIISLLTPNKKVPLGVYKVWFCKDYDEKFAKTYDAIARPEP